MGRSMCQSAAQMQRYAYNVSAFWVIRQEVHDPPALLDMGLGVGPQAVHQVWEHDTILDEEDLHHAADVFYSLTVAHNNSK